MCSGSVGGPDRLAAVVVATAGVVALTSFVADVTTQPEWTLLYSEDFSTPLNPASVPWVRDDYSEAFDTVMDVRGQHLRLDVRV